MPLAESLADTTTAEHGSAPVVVVNRTLLVVESGGGGVTDLTGAILTSTSLDCADSVGSYTSNSTDQPTGRECMGSLEITATDDECTFVTNQIPNDDIGEGAQFANEAGPVDDRLVITRSPELAESTSVLDLGATVIMLNGVKWEGYSAACFSVGGQQPGRETSGCGSGQLDNPWRCNIASPLNDFNLDVFLAHAQADGWYHDHSTPAVLDAVECEGVDVSPVIGFAADGFPLHGPCFGDDSGAIRAAQPSYELRSGRRQDIGGYTTPYAVGNVQSDDYNGQFIGHSQYVEGLGNLDECNGMVVDGSYGYYVTAEYPYVPACYSGTRSTEFD